MRDSILSAFGAEPRPVDDVAKRVGCEERAVRTAIDAARGKGWEVTHTAPGPFQIAARTLLAPRRLASLTGRRSGGCAQ